MKTTMTHDTAYTNMTNNERGFRLVLALGLLSATVSGAVVAPLSMFGASMVAVYLAMTSIMAIDPVYAATRSTTPRRHTGGNAMATGNS